MSKNKPIICAIIVFTAIILCFAAIVTLPFNFFINDALLGGMVRDMKGELGGDSIEVIDIQSATGKLYGNGNGIEFFGAALVRGDESDIEATVEKLSKRFDVAGYFEQTDARIDIKYADRADLCYDIQASFDSDTVYYTVYFFHTQKFCNEFDIRGH